jgi:UDP-N-acetylglucosamine-lysosomal-enzyme
LFVRFSTRDTILFPILTHQTRRKRKSLIINEDQQVAFVMVDNDFAEMRKKFDGIRNFRHKFICLNDNMNHNERDSANSVQVLNDFYESLVPLPSGFELPKGVENPELYLDELNKYVPPFQL